MPEMASAVPNKDTHLWLEKWTRQHKGSSEQLRYRHKHSTREHETDAPSGFLSANIQI